MISPSERINTTVRARRSECDDLTGGIISNKEGQQIKRDTAPLINDLEMQDVFEDEDEEEGAGVTDLIKQVGRLLVHANELKELIAGINDM